MLGLAGYFEYLFTFWLHRYLLAKQALDLKKSAKPSNLINKRQTRNGVYFRQGLGQDYRIWNFEICNILNSINQFINVSGLTQVGNAYGIPWHHTNIQLFWSYTPEKHESWFLSFKLCRNFEVMCENPGLLINWFIFEFLKFSFINRDECFYPNVSNKLTWFG